jgi:signal transduction histidine kinase
MRERAEQLGGRLEINSSDHGTTVRARLPLERGAGG